MRFQNKKLIELREKNNLNQAEFGREIGASKQSVNMWEQGYNVPIVTSLIKICTRFDVEIEYFFEHEDARKI